MAAGVGLGHELIRRNQMAAQIPPLSAYTIGRSDTAEKIAAANGGRVGQRVRIKYP